MNFNHQEIVFIPQHHKNFIYNFLSIKDLLNLSETCKIFYQDENRKEIIQFKLIDSCFYSPNPLLQESHIRIFPSIMNYYFERLKKMKFTEQSITQMQYNNPFFIQSFLKLESKEKILIVKNLGKYISDIWEYVQTSLKSHYMNVPLFITFESFLKCIFVNETNEIRFLILNELSIFSKRTKNSDRVHEKNRYSYLFKEQNRYTIDEFICNLGLFYRRDLSTIFEIADLLESYDKMYLYDFLHEIFQPFIDCQYLSSMKDDEYVVYLEDHLGGKYHMSSDKTYKDRLFELFSCNYMIHQEFEWALEFRTKRLYGIDDEEEDYDY